MLSVTNNGIESNEKMNFKGLIKNILFLYRKGFWKFWIIYLVSFLLIKGVMLGFYWLISYFQDNTFIGFNLVQSNFYMEHQDLNTASTLDPFISEETYITKSLLLYLFLEVLYQALLAIPLALSILVAKNIFDKGDEKLKHQIKDILILIVPLLIIGVITNLLVKASTYFWYLPGLIIMALTSLVYPIAIEEKLNPIATIKRSFQLAKEQFFNILGIVLIVVVIQLLILSAGKLFATLLVYSPTTANSVLNVYNSVAIIYQYGVVQSIIYSIVAPFTAISAFVMYREAISIRTLKLSSAVDSTSKFAKSSQFGKSTLSVNKQVRKAVLGETKSMIKEKFCSSCGAETDPDSRFCDSCGRKI